MRAFVNDRCDDRARSFAVKDWSTLSAELTRRLQIPLSQGFGLGSLLNAGRELLRMDQVMGVMAVVMLVGLLADLVFFSPIERWLRRSRGLER